MGLHDSRDLDQISAYKIWTENFSSDPEGWIERILDVSICEDMKGSECFRTNSTIGRSCSWR
jgi:hypothetical protein